mgnify:CR=1 FL=1
MSLRRLGAGIKQVAPETALPAGITLPRAETDPERGIGEPLGGGGKRATDLLIASIALLAALPVMVLVALLIKLTMGGAVIFAHERVGHGGRRFRCYKFRTMLPDGDRVLEEHLARHPEHRRAWEMFQKLPVDPRATPLGTVLRRSSLDELPQLLNVLAGEMSIVGPRPVTPAELARYGAHGKHYLLARPGLTGLWQVSGRNLLDYRKRVMLDTSYVRSWSLTLDLWIMLRTIPAVLSPHETS